MAKANPLPSFFSPMLATLVKEPFDDSEWTFEVKWDGYRTLAFIDQQHVELKSRNNKLFNERFYPIYDAVKAWGIRAVVDGEIVVVDERGLSAFNSLQNWRSEADGLLLYYVFDILWKDGKSLLSRPLSERRAILNDLIPSDSLIRQGFCIEEKGLEFFHVAQNMGLEGIMAKRADSLYIPGDRTRDWLKIKVQKRQEVVIGGYTKNEGTSKYFSALLLGVFDRGKFRYVGKVGTGFNQKQQKEMLARFQPLIQNKPSFEAEPDYNKPSRFRPNPPRAKAFWLKPELVCEIHFTEITEDGVFRHPSFVAMRDDKKARDVVREIPVPLTPDQLNDAQKKGSFEQAIIKTPAKRKRKTLLNPKDKTQVRKIGGQTLKFTNLSKLFWPEDGIAKRDLINYYYQVAPYILPYLKNRPQSLNRFPNGIYGHSFYQKNVTGKVPGWIDKFPYRSAGEADEKNYMLGNNEASLLYMANLGAIEMNPWNSTVQKPDHPDWCILDLDPDRGNTFEQVIEVAQAIHSLLTDIDVPHYCKTSGSTGLHIYIPMGGRYDYDQCQLFGKLIASNVQEALPDFTSIERMTKNRKGKVYIDYLQNRPTATLAAPYSVRPKPGATVSMPLHWDEVKPGLQMQDFTMHNAVDRVREMGDIFKPVLGKGIDMEKVLETKYFLLHS